jgi:hypothetical protein
MDLLTTMYIEETMGHLCSDDIEYQNSGLPENVTKGFGVLFLNRDPVPAATITAVQVKPGFVFSLIFLYLTC